MAQPTIAGLTLDAGSGGSDLAIVSYAGEEYQGCLLCWWDGTNTVNYVESAKPLPVGGNTAKDGSGTAYALLVDADGHLQIDVLSCASHAVTNAGTFAVQATQAGTWNVATVTTVSAVTAITNALPAGDNNIGNVDIVTMPADTFAADAQAYGKGVLIQGDDGTDRRAILVGTDGHVQVDVLSCASHAVTNTVLSVVGGGTEASAQRVTLANDSTGVLSVDDNSASLTVDTTGTSGLEVVQDTAADLNVTEASAADIKAAVEIMDDWDESNRAMVNIIVGQAGIAAGAGAMGVTVPRVTIATDDTHFGTVGAASDIDGVVHGQLRYIADQLVTIDSDTNNIKTAVELIDNAVDGNYLNVNVNAAGTDLTMNAGVLTAQTQRVTIATDDEVNNLLGTIDADTSALFGCVAGTELQVDVVAALPAGTNAIGKLAANSGVDIGDVDVTSISAGTNTIGGVIGQHSTSVAYDGTTACTIKRATGLAASGTAAMVAAVGAKKIRCLALSLLATSATVTNVYIANDDNDILGDSSNPIPLATDADGDNTAGFVLPWNPGGWFETDTVNEALNLILSAAQDVIYAITYIEVS